MHSYSVTCHVLVCDVQYLLCECDIYIASYYEHILFVSLYCHVVITI